MPHRLFLLEDEAHLAFGLEFNLKAEGYEVDVAGSLAEARTFPLATYDLLILDVMLPDGSGLDFCRELRNAGNRKPVLFLTARGTPDDIVEGLERGGDDYVTKPFELRELLARIAAVIRRQTWGKAAPDLASYRFGSSEIDFTSHKASVRGHCQELTALEVKLLRYFFDREGQVVSREDLLSDVWEVSSQANTRTVDNFLVRLRKLFEPDPARPVHFQTVRGIGYRFVAKP